MKIGTLSKISRISLLYAVWELDICQILPGTGR